MDNPDSAVPLGGFCENCGHFAGRHQELRCHFPRRDDQPVCPCPGMMWGGKMYEMDMNAGPKRLVPHYFDHLKGFYYPNAAANDNAEADK